MLSTVKSLSFVALAITAAQFGNSGAATAQDDSIKELLACDKIKDPADKLECFNAAIEILKQEEADKEQLRTDGVLKDRPRTRASAKASDFGFSAEELAKRDNARDNTKPPKQQIFTIQRSWQDVIGKYYFLMTNGQVWKEIGGSHLIVPKRAKTIRIKRNIMGGYNAFIEGMNGRRGTIERVR